MSQAHALPMPFVSAWDPRATASGSMDPLGALRLSTSISATLLPGVTTITTRVRYLSWVCAGLHLLDGVIDGPEGGRAARARRQRILVWERLVALATGMYALAEGLDEGDEAWRQLRGVSYVRRAVEDNVLTPAFPMLRNQAGIGGVGTYWVTLVAGGLVEDNSGELTPRGMQLADSFLRHHATPEKGRLLRVLRGQTVRFAASELVEWGGTANLGAARATERSILADTLLEPPVHRWMALAMRSTDAAASDRVSFQRLYRYLEPQREMLPKRLAAVIAVTIAFEDLHRELLFRFDQIRSMEFGRPVPVKRVTVETESELPPLAAALADALNAHGASLPRSVAEAAHAFSHAVAATVRASTPLEIIRSLIGHHERVQAGKLDASRQPKAPWVELRGTDLVIAPRYALSNPPDRPNSSRFTHAYRLEQFGDLLSEADAWELAS